MIRALNSADDLYAVSRIYEQSWCHAYHGIIAQDYLDRIPQGQWVQSLRSPGRQVLVLVDQATPPSYLGTVSFGQSRSPEFADWGEIMSIYLMPQVMGQGYGKVLMQAALGELRRQGYSQAFLWVLQANVRACKFYEGLGFNKLDVERWVTIGSDSLLELAYAYSL